MRFRRSVAAATALLAVAAGTAVAHQSQLTSTTEYADGSQLKGSAVNMRLVGHADLGMRGYNADVWVHEQYAYVGSWGFGDWAAGGDGRFCPEPAKSGVAVIDARDPAKPRQVAKLQQPPGTSVEDVVVYTAKYGRQAGRDIAVGGIQVCGGSRYDTAIFRGLIAWDVTDPSRPVELGRRDTGCCTRGLHELEVQHRADLRRTFVYASVPTSEYDDAASPTGRRDQRGRGDFRLIDVTDPRAPVETANWGVRRNAVGGLPAAGIGCDADPIYGHSAEPSADGRRVFVAHWDSGFVELDVSDPAKPVYRARTTYAASADGDAHSSQYDEGRGLLFTADEDFCKTSGAGTEKGWGYLRAFRPGGTTGWSQVGTFKTANAIGTDDRKAGDYTIHNPLLEGTDLYVSWYTDGIRVLDTRNPAAIREVASFVPPAANNPVQPSQRGVLTNTTQVWGVAYDKGRDLVFASDMNSGLWIVKRTDR
ncbi:MAG TPA: hypothetical protein VHF89_03310 [Solirubrobacteraceae bacterium]|nr:hypothetical protein [Solirubrobacteraceae bacterium]